MSNLFKNMSNSGDFHATNQGVEKSPVLDANLNSAEVVGKENSVRTVLSTKIRECKIFTFSTDHMHMFNQRRTERHQELRKRQLTQVHAELKAAFTKGATYQPEVNKRNGTMKKVHQELLSKFSKK